MLSIVKHNIVNHKRNKCNILDPKEQKNEQIRECNTIVTVQMFCCRPCNQLESAQIYGCSEDDIFWHQYRSPRSLKTYKELALEPTM